MEQYCVLCLKQDSGIPFSDFSLPINESSSVFECYQLLTSINFNNEFNAKICDNCLQNLTIFYKFRCQAIKNYDTIVSWKIDGSDVPENRREDMKDIPLHLRIIEDVNTWSSGQAMVKMEWSPQDLISLETNASVKEEEHDFVYPRIKDPVQLRKKRKKHKLYDKVVKKRSKKSESEGKSLTCEDCVDLEFSTAYSLWKHNRIVHSNQEDPDTSTQSYSKFINEYKKSNKVLCSYCGLSFRSDSVKKHILTMHFKQKNFMCDYCGKGFLVKQVMKEHMFRHIKHKTFKCDLCDHMGVTQATVNSHKKAKHQEPTWNTCTYPDCTYKYKMVTQLKYHTARVHLGIKPHVCECGKSFTSLCNLTEHKAVHSDEKNFECPLCKERFKTKTLLTIHHKKAHEKARFPCEICNQPFHSPSNLKIHVMAVHEGIRNFECNLCDKSYTTRKYLLDHVKEIHFKSKISCEVCGTKLARVVNYKMHVKAKHKDLNAEKMASILQRIKTIRPDYEKMEFYYS